MKTLVTYTTVLISVGGFLFWKLFQLLFHLWPKARNSDDLGLILSAPMDLFQAAFCIAIGIFGALIAGFAADWCAQIVTQFIFSNKR